MKGNTMTDTPAVEKKERKSNSGEGWYIYTQDRDGSGLLEAAGPFDNLKRAELAFKEQAQSFDGQTVLIAKVQRRIKVRVETVKMVKFE